MIDRQKFFKLVTAIAAGTAMTQMAAGCSSSTNSGSSGGCTPGDTKSCACPGSGSGTQSCKDDGGGYDACTGCPTATGGSSGSGGATTGSGGATTSGGAPSLGGTSGAGGSGGAATTGGAAGTGGVTATDAGPSTVSSDAGFVQSDAGGSACGACTGCCASGTCVPLPSQTAAQCGLSAAACAACGSGEICVSGACMAATTGCSPSTCPTGCCDEGGACVLPDVQSYTACGGGGAACSTCDWGVICSSPTCTTEIDSNAQFYVAVDSAEVTEKDSSGNTWDPAGGLPDPFVCFTDGLVTGCTSPQSDTSTASWTGSAGYLADSSGNPVLFSAQQIISGALQFSVWDYDPFDPNDLVQRGQYASGIVIKQSSYVVTNLGSVISMTWRLYP